MTDKERGMRMLEFKLWLKKIPADKLRDHLLDLFWRGKLDGHQLEQAFLLDKDHGVKLKAVTS